MDRCFSHARDSLLWTGQPNSFTARNLLATYVLLAPGTLRREVPVKSVMHLLIPEN